MYLGINLYYVYHCTCRSYICVCLHASKYIGIIMYPHLLIYVGMLANVCMCGCMYVCSRVCMSVPALIHYRSTFIVDVV